MFKNSNGEYVNVFDIFFGSDKIENYIYTLAEAHAIDLIAKTIAKCEIQTFEKQDKKIVKNKGDLYWTLNYQPNYNEKGTDFLYKLVTKLLVDKTALVIINKKLKDNLLYVADTYNSSTDILRGKKFTDVTVTDDEGNSLTLAKTYDMDNSIYFTLKNSMLTTASENFKKNTGKILKAVQKNLISANTPKWKLKKPGGQPTMIDIETKQPITYEDYKKKITEGLFSEEEAIVMLSEAFDLMCLTKDTNKDTTSFEN